MRLRKTVRTLHLWLGMASGPIVFVLCATGCLYAFETEFRDWLQDYPHVPPQHGPMLLPSQLKAIAERDLPGEKASRVYYQGSDRAAYVQFGNLKTQHYTLVFLNPFDGTLLKTVDMNREFFHIVFSLHYRLLLPPKIGTTIVDYSTLVFVVVLATGLVNWWPRSRKAVPKRRQIRWQGHWRRRNYDLHNVLVGASLPVTGFLIWWGKQKRNPPAAQSYRGRQKGNRSRETSDEPRKSTLKSHDLGRQRLATPTGSPVDPKENRSA